MINEDLKIKTIVKLVDPKKKNILSVDHNQKKFAPDNTYSYYKSGKHVVRCTYAKILNNKHLIMVQVLNGAIIDFYI